MICQSDMAGKEPAATCGAQGVHLSLRTGMYGKALGLLLFLGMLSVTVFPQSKKSELNVGYGLFGSSRAI